MNIEGYELAFAITSLVGLLLILLLWLIITMNQPKE